MNGEDIGKLLGLMALADGRKPPEDEQGRKAMIAFWLEMIGDLTYADCAQAIRDHYRDSREWIMPADIRRRVKAARRARLQEAPAPDLIPPPELLDDDAAYAAWQRTTAKRIADGKPDLRAIGGAS